MNIAPEAVTASTSQSTYSYSSGECYASKHNGLTEINLTVKPVATTGFSFITTGTIPAKFGRPTTDILLNSMSVDGGYTDAPMQLKLDTSGNISCRLGVTNMRYNFYIVY